MSHARRLDSLRAFFRGSSGRRAEPRVAFILGHQRSGTSMLLRELGKHRDVATYGEASEVMEAFRIKKIDCVRELVQRSRAELLVFKPLQDSHRAREFLTAFPRARVVWMVRHYGDVVNSCLERGWGPGTRLAIMQIAAGGDHPDAAGLNTTPAHRRLLEWLSPGELSEASCLAIHWYLRNSLYVDLDLSGEERVRLQGYEELVRRPVAAGRELLEFLGLPSARDPFRSVHARSVERSAAPSIESRVKAICDRLHAELLAEREPAQGEC